MIKPVASQTHAMTLNEVLARLAGNPVVEGVLTLGSTREGTLAPHSDYDLLVVLSEMPVRLHVLLTTIDSRLADVLFASSGLIDRILAGEYAGAPTAYEGTLVEQLKSGDLVHDRDGRIRRAQALLAGRSWLQIPDERQIYAQAVHGIHYNLLQNRRYLAAGTQTYLRALDIRLHYSLMQVLLGYFSVRRLPWQGEKAALAHWQKNDAEFLALFEAYEQARDREERFALYQELAERALAPLGGLWPYDAVNVVLEGENWTLADVQAGSEFWESLVNSRQQGTDPASSRCLLPEWQLTSPS